MKTDEHRERLRPLLGAGGAPAEQGVEIADGAITAEKANFADLGAVVATLGTCTITESLNFADGVVVTNALGLNAATDVGAAFRETNLVISSLNTWEDVCTLTVSVAAGTAIILLPQIDFNRSAKWSTNRGTYKVYGDVSVRITRNGTEISSGTKTIIVDSTAGSGSKTYKIQARCTKPDNGTYEQLDYDPEYGTYSTVDVPYTVGAQDATPRIGYAHLIVQSFKR